MPKNNPFLGSSLVQTAIIFLALFALVQALVVLKDALVPLCLAVVCSILLQPLVKFFVGKGLPIILAIFIPLTAIFILIFFLVFWMSGQINMLVNTFPQLVQKWDDIVFQITSSSSEKFGFTQQETKTWMSNEMSNLLQGSRSLLAPILMSFGGWLLWLLFIPVYTFMILYYRPWFVKILFQSDAGPGLKNIQTMLHHTTDIIKSYLRGLLIESGIVSVLNVSGLLLLGIDYAVLLGVIGGMLNMVPYIGGMVAVALPLFIALATKPLIYSLYVLLLYTFIQLLDNNVIMPRVVAYKVQVNGLVSVLVVVLGGVMWGVAGMFFSIPFSAFLKVSFDHYPGLEPWGKLLGVQEENSVRTKT